MSYSITGLSYLSFFFATLFFVYRLFQYWQKEKEIISKLWFLAVSFFLLFALIKAIGGLFFANNLAFLKGTIDIGAFFQALSFATMAYFIVYVKFRPRVSPWHGFILILILGLIATYLTIKTPFYPIIEPSGAINWGSPPNTLILMLLRAFLFITILIPTIFILFQQYRLFEDLYSKRKTLGLILFFVFGLIVSLLDFLFINIFKVEAIWRDIFLITASIILLITLILTQKTPSAFEKTGQTKI